MWSYVREGLCGRNQVKDLTKSSAWITQVGHMEIYIYLFIRGVFIRDRMEKTQTHRGKSRCHEAQGRD